MGLDSEMNHHQRYALNWRMAILAFKSSSVEKVAK